MASIYDLAANYEEEPQGLGAPRAPVQPVAPVAPVAVAPNLPAQAAPMSGAPRVDQLGSLIERYFPQGDDYGAELKTARETYNKEAEAFKTMLEKALAPEPAGDDRLSKAEMYFRLAAAFGAPTKTGNFMESLGAAGGEAAGILKERRASDKESKQRGMQLALEAQKLRMGAAKEDLTTLRGLAAEGMKDKRTVATKLIEEYVRSGQPQSSAGKQAVDEGLKPGSPEFQARVSQLSELNTDRQMAQINATLASLTNAQANQLLAQQKFQFQQDQAAKLTGPELKLKTDTEDLIAQTEQAYANLKRALELNPNTFDASAVDTVQRKALELAGSKDPKLMNTRELENLLEKAALSQLKATFPGAISNDERKALMDTQGLAAKSIEERKRIMENAARAMRNIYLRNRKRLNEINQGLYRNTELGEGLE
jgi:hypothetical protein